MCHGDRCFWSCFSKVASSAELRSENIREICSTICQLVPVCPDSSLTYRSPLSSADMLVFTYLVHAPPLAPPLWPRLQHGAKRCLVGPSAGVEERKQEPSSAPSLLKVKETPTCSDVCSVDAASASPLGDAARGELTCLRRGEDATLLRWPRSGSRRRHKPHHAA